MPPARPPSALRQALDLASLSTCRRQARAAAPEASIAATCPPPTYQRRQPEGSVLYRTLAAHLDRFLATISEDEGPGLPSFVTRELRAYLRCGVLEHGCVHVRCERCEDEMVVAFSCKGRGFCPSCGGRRMSELAAQLVDRSGSLTDAGTIVTEEKGEKH